jgi:spoIIIJ-associated protein
MPAKKITKTKKKDNPSKVDLVKETTDKTLELMGMKAKASVSEDSENEAIRVEIDAKDEAGLLIGNRGRTLQSIQLLVGIIVRNKMGDWVRVIVNVSDWREKEEERLKKLALQVAERAKETGDPQNLYNLSSSQRRIIHLALSDDSLISTESVGEGKDRCLVISSRK